MVEKKTTVVLEAKAKGFAQARQEVRSTFAAMNPDDVADGFKELFDRVEETFKGIGDLSGSMREFGDIMRESLSQSATGLREMLDNVEKMTSAIDQMTRAKQRDRTEDERGARRRGFAMGVMQGAGVGEYFPGQGLGENVAGRMLGGAGRRAGSGVWSATVGSAFNGAQAVATGLGAIPIVGGMAAGMVQNGLAATQDALAYQHLQAQYGSLGISMAGTPAARLASDGDRTIVDAFREAMKRDEQDFQNRALAQGFGAESWYGMGTKEEYQDLRVNKEAALRRQMGARLADAENRMRLDERASGTGGLGGVAQGFGYSQQDALQLAASIMQIAGGSGKQLNEGNFALALGLGRGYGVGGDVAGAFMRGGRTGATGLGGEGALVAALKSGMELGLEGSDLSNYMRETAQTLMQFDQTGIPLDVNSLSTLAKSVAGAGLGGMQGARVARGLRDVGADLSSGGPQNAAQFAVFRHLFGYKGGGVDDFFDASMRAANGEFTQGGFESLVASVSQSGNPKANAIALQQALQQAGINISLPQAFKIISGDREALAEVGDITRESIIGTGLAKTPDSVARDAGIRNQRLGVGSTLLDEAQTFEEAQTRVLKGAVEFEAILKSLGNVAKEIAALAGPGAERLANILEVLTEKVKQ